MRILQIVDGFYPSTGGSELQVALLSDALVRRGHHVEIVAPRLDPSMPAQEVVGGIPVTRITYPRVRVAGAAFLCLAFAIWLMKRRGKFDALHVHMAKNLGAVAGALRPLSPWTLTVKISGAWEFEGGILDPRLRSRPLFRLYNLLLARADHMHCISEFTRLRLREAGYAETRLRRIPNAVDLDRFDVASRPARNPGADRHVVFVGRVEPVKGLDVLLEAWSQCRFARAARLTIAGDGSRRAALEAMARDLGIASSVTFAGEVRDVPALLADADVYVQPSHLEGLANSVLEAMAMGLPIVATRISGNVDVVSEGENGLLVPPGDPPALARSLRLLVEDAELSGRMGSHSRKVASQRFGIPAVVERLERIYARTACDPQMIAAEEREP